MGLQRSEVKVEINKGSSEKNKKQKLWRKKNNDRPWKSGQKRQYMIEAQ